MHSAREFGMRVVSVSGSEELVLCPFHEDRKPSAWFNRAKCLFYCAVCNLGLNEEQLSKRLGREFFGTDEDIPDYNFFDESKNYDVSVLAAYSDYIQERGIDEATAHLYGVRWRERKPEAAVLPLTNQRGQVQGLVYRYQNPSAAGTRYRFDGKPTPLWPMHLLPKSQGLVVVTEGAWSAMRIHSYLDQAGVVEPTFFALLGAKANHNLAQVLAPYNAVVLYDGDQAGCNACRKMRSIAPLVKSYTVKTSPDDMSDRQIAHLMERVLQKHG